MFAPLSFLIGVEWDDCREVARLLGVKIFTSELLAFQDLGVVIKEGRISVNKFQLILPFQQNACDC